MTSERTLRILELPAIREIVAERTSFEPGRELAQAMAPVTDIGEAERLHDETQAARQLVAAVPSAGLRGARDIRGALRRARLGGVLDPQELGDIAATVRAADVLFAQVRPYPPLAARARFARPPTPLAQAIDHAISPEGEVLDRASVALATARAELRAAQARLQQRVDALVRTPALAKMLQEPIVTQRGGRYVVPVKAEFAGAVKGIVHDRSASGATVFIEPLDILDANNRVREAELAERAEVERVLAELSRRVETDADDLDAVTNVLAALDLILARAHVGEATASTRPRLTSDGTIDLVGARHPLLVRQLGDAVVPIDVRFGGDVRALVITGPNTGGKTVTLRTIGLLTLMAACGMQIPAAPGSAVPVVARVFADIGDEQSIQQSLSTFSSHLRNVVETLGQARSGDLALLDEIGAGTDPDEGAALAMAVLETLLATGVLVAATTHYPELKAFALNTTGVQNASVEFDPETLRPTYRVHLGLPGASNAFAIASRLGVDRGVLARAEGHLSELHRSLERTLREAERARTDLAEELERAQVAAGDARRALDDARRDAERIQAEANDRLRRARGEADDVLLQARRAVRQAEEARDRASRRDLVEEARTALEEAEAARAAIASPSPAATAAPASLEVGARVLVQGIDEPGTLMWVDDRGIAEVAAGAMRVRVAAAELRAAGEPEAAPIRARLPTVSGSADRVPLQLDIRGARADEAIAAVERYLNDAAVAGYDRVRIVHGKGTGALRAAIRTALAGHPLVREVATAARNEGGEGATIVTL
jgi:DNA mismatch repair protein MutS2